MVLAQQLKPLIDHLKSQKKLTFFQGAGISTGAGIPDFRSPETGLYANLARLNLPYAEAVFDIDYFEDHPEAFYTLAGELYPGKFQPTSFHYLIRILQDKGLLQRVYTQNIDTLERVAGVKDEYIIEAHGSFSSNHCIKCDEEMLVSELKKFMEDDKIPKCSKCKGYVKPDIVFFGESLPVKFFSSWEEDEDDIEFAIVVGTSMTVHPFASLPMQLTGRVPRILVNKEVVGDFTRKNKKDTVILEACDEFAEEVCKLMGWEDDLNELKTSKFDFGVEEEIKEITEEMEKLLGSKKDKDEVESESKLSKEANTEKEEGSRGPDKANEKEVESDKSNEKTLESEKLKESKE